MLMFLPYYWLSLSEAQEVNGNISYFLSSESLLITGVNQGNCKLEWETFAFVFLAFILMDSGWWINILSSIPQCKNLVVQPPLWRRQFTSPPLCSASVTKASRPSQPCIIHTNFGCPAIRAGIPAVGHLSSTVPIKPASNMHILI